MTRGRPSLFVFLFAGLGCSGSALQPGAAAGAAGSGNPAPEGADADGGCPYFDFGTIAAASDSCPASPRVCEAGSGVSSCLFSPIQDTLARPLRACANCGEVEAGFDHGCVTTVAVVHLGGTVADAGDCVRSLLMNTRWACAPDSGWVRVYLGSCTIQ